MVQVVLVVQVVLMVPVAESKEEPGSQGEAPTTCQASLPNGRLPRGECFLNSRFALRNETMEHLASARGRRARKSHETLEERMASQGQKTR